MFRHQRFYNLEDCLPQEEESPASSFDPGLSPKQDKSEKIRRRKAEILPLPIRSDCQQLEPSFQRKFFSQHNSVFHQKFWNLLEPIIQNAQTCQEITHSNIHKKFQQQGEPVSFRDLLNDGSVSLPEDQLRNLRSDLKKMVDLQKWIDGLGTQYTKPFVCELMRIALDIWFEVRHINFKYQSGPQLLERAESWNRTHAKLYFQRKDFPYLNIRFPMIPQSVDSTKQQQSFYEFVHSFTVTVLFLLGGFFQNPCLKEDSKCSVDGKIDQPKRQSKILEDEPEWFLFQSQSANILPRKQLKQ